MGSFILCLKKSTSQFFPNKIHATGPKKKEAGVMSYQMLPLLLLIHLPLGLCSAPSVLVVNRHNLSEWKPKDIATGLTADDVLVMARAEQWAPSARHIEKCNRNEKKWTIMESWIKLNDHDNFQYRIVERSE